MVDGPDPMGLACEILSGTVTYYGSIARGLCRIMNGPWNKGFEVLFLLLRIDEIFEKLGESVMGCRG